MALLTIPEVAARLRIHQMTVRRHVKEGRLPALRVGRGIRVDERDLEQFMRPIAPAHEMTPEELRAWVRRPLTSDELSQIREGLEEMRRIREKTKPLGMSTATLIRAGRRMNEVAYGEKTLEELIAEES